MQTNSCFKNEGRFCLIEHVISHIFIEECMTKKGRILILFCNIFHDIDFTQLFYVKFVIKGNLET